ncbi:MAG: DNA repair protein RecO [Desulforhopalus sp.]
MVAHTRETEAIVLDCIEHGESDTIVTFFSQDAGKLTAIAKGAKRSKKRFVNKLELFSFLHITYQQKANRSLAFLSEADLHTGFIRLRRNLELYGIASVIREFLLIGVRENEPDDQIFRLSLWALHNLDQQQPPLTVLSLFLIRFYDYVGYRPDLQTCSQCEHPVSNSNRYSFDTTTGRIVCSVCSPHAQKRLALSHGTIKMLRSAQDQPMERLHRLKISGGILQETVALLQSYGNQLFQRDIASWKIVRRSHTPFKGA